MLMHDRPPAADFAKANGQAKIELDFIPVRLRSTVVLLLLALIWISLTTKWKSSFSQSSNTGAIQLSHPGVIFLSQGRHQSFIRKLFGR